jgi:hypothetical protein
MALRNEISELVYIILMLAEAEVAPGCGAVSDHGLNKPRDWFQKIMTSPSQSRGRFRHFIAARDNVTYLMYGVRKLIAITLVLLYLQPELNTMQYCFLHNY